MGKIYKMAETSNTNNILSGIYKITFPNNKCYIGLSNNIRKRIWDHNHNDYKLHRVVGNAIHYYGDVTEFEVLEEIDPKDRDLMNQREKYWINFYKSNQPNFGYNMTEGGDGGNVGFGVNNPNAAFNQQQLKQIINLLSNHKDISMTHIAKQYNVSLDTIANINKGKTYFQPNLKYPIRTQIDSNKNLLTGIKSSSAKLNDIQLTEIINLLKYSSYTFSDIANKFHVNISTISSINQGKRYHDKNLVYPIRDKQKIKQIQYGKSR